MLISLMLIGELNSVTHSHVLHDWSLWGHQFLHVLSEMVQFVLEVVTAFHKNTFIRT